MLFFVLACAHNSLINPKNVQSIAQETMKVAHPAATLLSSELIETKNSKKENKGHSKTTVSKFA